jgi:hypothetical protein
MLCLFLNLRAPAMQCQVKLGIQAVERVQEPENMTRIQTQQRRRQTLQNRLAICAPNTDLQTAEPVAAVECNTVSHKVLVECQHGDYSYHFIPVLWGYQSNLNKRGGKGRPNLFTPCVDQCTRALRHISPWATSRLWSQRRPKLRR